VIAVVDYGMGNVYSVLSALRYLGLDPVLTGDVKQVSGAEHLILPGVGSFRKGMKAIRKRGLDEAMLEAVNNRGAKILGICLGMQLLGSNGTEDGDTVGLNLIPNQVDSFDIKELDAGMKIPHVGFNVVRTAE
jgi:glutamine amidotransferase